MPPSSQAGDSGDATRKPWPAQIIGEHPRLLVTADNETGFRSVDELRAAVKHGQGERLWRQVKETADRAVESEPLTAFTPLPGRSEEDIKQGNREYGIANAAGQAVDACALASLLTGQAKYKAAALRQVETLFDKNAWPEWQDIYHRRRYNFDADLRTGMLCRDLGLAYDWLYPSLLESERRWFLDGLDRCGIQPYLRTIEKNPWWLDRMNNWTTCIVGGLGICGMALVGEHEQAERLIQLAVPRMHKYLEHYGSEGEFNECPSYSASSVFPVLFFSAYHYLCREPEVPEEIRFLRKHCIWEMYVTVPPGTIAPLGDGGPDRPAWYNTTFFPAVATATRDPVLQWFYLEHATEQSHDPIWELMFFDATLAPSAPTPEELPLGRVFPGYSGIISSRASWDQRDAVCAVIGKAGRGGVNHTHPDAGQVMIRGHGRRLIRDLGKVGYPAESKQHFYHFNTSGHNVVAFEGRELLWDRKRAGRIVRADFDNDLGGFWALDTTPFYRDARSVRRTVVHLLPGIVAVLDEAQFDRPGEIRMRWHPETPTEPDEQGAFFVRNEGVTLSGRVVDVDGGALRFAAGHHQYEAPYNRDRMGNLLPQRLEPYLDALTESSRCRILSVFAVYGPDEAAQRWTGESGSMQIETSLGSVHVQVEKTQLRVSRPDEKETITVPLP